MHRTRRYLVVDDNQQFAENLAEIIEEGSGKVDVVLSGDDALAKVANTKYDALISDMRMPAMGGAELVHRIRRLDRGLPAVVITAYTRDDDVDAARNEGVLAVLPKPPPVTRLMEIIAGARRDGLVAIIEDDVHLLDNLSEALRAHGFAAVTATSVMETERLGGVAPFAALVDLRVPGGPDGAAMNLLGERFPGLPMIVITAHADRPPPAAHETLFTKPFRTAELMEAVERLYRSQNA
jgi:DNA-binding NtrC family response regulator